MDYFNSLLPVLDSLGVFGYWIVLAAALIEALVLVGTFFPGGTFVALVGFAAANGDLNVWYLILYAAIGAIIGDSISYYLGKKGAAHIKEKHLIYGERFFEKYGSKSIFFGRFFAPLRAIVPFIAGISHMRTKIFFFWNVTGAVLWAAVHIFVGYIFGASLKSIEIWTTRIGFFVIVLVGIGIILWYVVKNYGFIINLARSVSVSILSAVLGNKDVQDLLSRYPRTVLFLKGRIDKTSFVGLPLTLLGVIFTYSLMTFVGITEDVLTLDPIVSVDKYVANIFVTHRDPFLTEIFLKITLLGSMETVVVLGIIFLAYLIFKKKKEYIYPFLITLLGTSFVTYIVKMLIHRARPSGLIPIVSETSFAFPSGHASIIVAFAGFVAYVLMRRRTHVVKNIKITFVAVLIIFLVGVSRVYLGAHFLSDVLAGYLMGFLWLIIGIILSEIYLHKNKFFKSEN